MPHTYEEIEDRDHAASEVAALQADARLFAAQQTRKGATMTRYRVSVSGFKGQYVERWEADSPSEAEQKARQRWQREFGDASAFYFTAQPERYRDAAEEQNGE